MKLILTSFGITGNLYNTENDPSIFYMMPPINMRSSYEVFAPDYVTFLLCDKLVMDERSYQRLQEKHHYLYSKTADTFRVLNSEGFLELVNFDNILSRNSLLLEKMLENDLSIINYWIDALSESVEIWDNFTREAKQLFPTPPSIPYYMRGSGGSVSLHDEMYNLLLKNVVPLTGQSIFMNEFDTAHAEINFNESNDFFTLQVLKAQYVRNELNTSRKRKKSRVNPALRETLTAFLSYINANIVISNEIGAAFHDWADMMPFYKKKFVLVGKENPEFSENQSASHKLFEIAFPEFNITDVSALLKLLTDKRINDLRQLVQDAADNKVEFDNNFAKKILKEVIVAEQKTARYRNIISYLTLPLDFIPWVGTIAEKIVDESAGSIVENKLKSKYRWFYLLSDVNDNGK